MNDDYPSSNGSGASWLNRLGKALDSGPRNRDDIKQFLFDATEQGILEPEALAMMEGALSVAEMQVRDVMIPRSQMAVLSADASIEEALPALLESGHSRFPVIGEDKDEVEGILLAKDLLQFFTSEPAEMPESTSLKKLMRKAVVIPESKRLNTLLRDFRASRNHMAIVVDEYGGVSGLVTIEDVLEEIVGEIDDEHDIEEEEHIRAGSNGCHLVQALTPIEEFNETFSGAMPDEEFDTVGGAVLAEFGRLPEVGERIALGPFEFRVLNADNRRLYELEMKLLG